MNIDDYNAVLEKIVSDDCKRIMNEILELYRKRVEVNKSFYQLVREKINPKYFYLLEDYYTNITNFIPEDLYICPNGKWALVTGEEFDEILLEEKYLVDFSKKGISKVIDLIINDLINSNSNDFFDVVNKYIKPLYEKDNQINHSRYIVDEIYRGLKKRGYIIESISPLIIKPLN